MDILEKNNAKFSEIRYSPEFKDMVCCEFLKGDVSKGFLERKYNLGHGRVVLWMRRLGYIAKAPTPFVMSQNQKTPDETSTNKRIKEPSPWSVAHRPSPLLSTKKKLPKSFHIMYNTKHIYYIVQILSKKI